jgi:hypothetical protein
VRTLAASTVIDYHTQRFEEEVRAADAVIDLVGGETQARSFQVLRRGGKLISTVSLPDQNLAQSHGFEAKFFLVNVTRQFLANITALIDGGELKTRVGAVLPLADGRREPFQAGTRTASAKGKNRACSRGKLKHWTPRWCTAGPARGMWFSPRGPLSTIDVPSPRRSGDMPRCEAASPVPPERGVRWVASCSMASHGGDPELQQKRADVQVHTLVALIRRALAHE